MYISPCSIPPLFDVHILLVKVFRITTKHGGEYKNGRDVFSMLGNCVNLKYVCKALSLRNQEQLLLKLMPSKPGF